MKLNAQGQFIYPSIPLSLSLLPPSLPTYPSFHSSFTISYSITEFPTAMKLNTRGQFTYPSIPLSLSLPSPSLLSLFSKFFHHLFFYHRVPDSNEVKHTRSVHIPLHPSLSPSPSLPPSLPPIPLFKVLSPFSSSSITESLAIVTSF